MKVLVTGSRNWLWRDREVIEQALQEAGATVVVEGGADGADTVARQAAYRLSIPCRTYPADWKLHGKAAGILRNQEMLDKEHTEADPIRLCLAFPLGESRGTRDMMRRAYKAGIEVREFAEDLAGFRQNLGR